MLFYNSLALCPCLAFTTLPACAIPTIVPHFPTHKIQQKPYNSEDSSIITYFTTSSPISCVDIGDRSGHVPLFALIVSKSIKCPVFRRRLLEPSFGLTGGFVSATPLIFKWPRCAQLSRALRTCIVLQTIKHLNTIETLLDVGFSDYWSPVTERKVLGCLRTTARTAVVETEKLIFIKLIDLEKGADRKQCCFM